MQKKSLPANTRKVLIVPWLLFAVLTLAATTFPVRFGLIKLAFVFAGFVLWLGAIYFVWPRKQLRVLVLAVSALPLFLLLPARTIDHKALRVSYVESLRNYKDTPYVWGGETGRGLDCSGLLRRALIDTNLKTGLQTANPALLREAFALWWNDCSAKEMREGYSGRTQRLFEAEGLNTLSDSRLRAGDFAVTSPGGAHVLAYIGDQTWIEADPNAKFGFKVIEVQVPTGNAWFSQNVSILRWKQFQ